MNKQLEFYVARTASKLDIKGAVRALFQVVSKVNTRITKEGKLAIVKLAEGHSAEDLSNRLEYCDKMGKRIIPRRRGRGRRYKAADNRFKGDAPP